jgi:hypothetical protein
MFPHFVPPYFVSLVNNQRYSRTRVVLRDAANLVGYVTAKCEARAEELITSTE